MRSRIMACTLFLVAVFLPIELQAQIRPGGDGGTGQPSEVKNPRNPKFFEGFLASPSSPIMFLGSERARALLADSPDPQTAAAVRALSGLEPPSPDALSSSANDITALSQAISGLAAPLPMAPDLPCVAGVTNFGTVFNLEPPTNARPQDEESVAFFPGGGLLGQTDLVVGGANDFRGPGTSGYYAHIGLADNCSANYDGNLPPVTLPIGTGLMLSGGGDPVIIANTNNDTVYYEDLRFGFGFTPGFTGGTSVGIMRNTAGNLKSANCPNGTHTPVQASACWPLANRKVVATHLLGGPQFFFDDKEHGVVDDRPAGAGAGASDLYITFTRFERLTAVTPNRAVSRIFLVTCKSDLSMCESPEQLISGGNLTTGGGDEQTQFSHITMRPDGSGNFTISYINILGNFFTQTFQIKYVTCTANPLGAPNPAICSAPTLVTTETQPLRFGWFLAAEDFRTATYPTHAHQVQGDGTIQTYVTWAKCKVAPLGSPFFVCPDADVAIIAADTTANPAAPLWGAVAPVDSGPQDQIFPWMARDASTDTLNIAYYSATGDPPNHRHQLMLSQIAPGLGPAGNVPNPIVSDGPETDFNEPAADPFLGGFFFGDYIGVTAGPNVINPIAGASRIYMHFTANDRFGLYNGIPAQQQDNHLVRVIN